MAAVTKELVHALYAVQGEDNPLDALRAVVTARSELDRVEADLVTAALVRGATFEAIGEAVGISKQSAHRRWAELA